MLKIIGQCDSSWGSLHLGTSPKTLCSDGCVTTDLSVLSGWYGNYINPGKLVAKLKYTPAGLYYWQSGNGVLPFKFVYRYYDTYCANVKVRDVKLLEILNSKDGACILQVNNYKHWVLLVGYSRIYGFKIFDPFYKEIVYLSKRYGKNIQGFAEFIRA